MATLILGLAGGAVAPQAAHADPMVRTNTEVNLRARPGERAPTLARLDEGQSVRVLGRQGRWLKVSVKGKVGWITRTQVDDDGEPMQARASSEKKRTAAAKARKKGWSSMEDDSVGSDAVESDDAEPVEEEPAEEAETAASDEEEARPSKKQKAKKTAMVKKDEPADDAEEEEEKPSREPASIEKGAEVVTVRGTSVRAKASKKSDEKWDVAKGTSLTVVAINSEGDWIKVEDADGEKGWIARKDLQARSMDEDSDSGSGDAIVGSDDDGERSVRKSAMKQGPMSMWAAANVGILTKTQTYASGGQGLRANYGLANTAPAVIGNLGFVRRMGKLHVGADAGVIATVGGSGIAIAAGDGGAAEQLGWTALEIDVHGNAHYLLSPGSGAAVGARAGYHVSSVTVDVSQNAKLPSEKLSGITVGAAFVMPRLTDRIGMQIGADYLLGATLLQTQGLQDGDSSAATVIFANAGASYAFTPKLGMTLTYQMAYEKFAFTGANQREATATNAQREDIQHVFGLGASYTF